MILEQLIVVDLATEVDALSELDQVSLLFLRWIWKYTNFVAIIARAIVTLLLLLRIRVWHVMITPVRRGSTTEASDGRSHDRKSLRGFHTLLVRHMRWAIIYGCCYSTTLMANQVTAVLPLNELVLDDKIADLEIEAQGPTTASTLTDSC